MSIIQKEIRARIKEVLPIEQDFKVGDIVDKVFPNLVRYDTEGRTYNRGSAVVARTLRKMPGIIEIKHLTFWAADYAKS
jgi:hypothetical protein